MTNIELPFAATPVVQYTADSIQGSFEKYLLKNPKVYQYFKQFALEMHASGRKKCGAKLIAERIRWEVYFTSVEEDDEFKLPNNYVSRLARKLMAEVPELQGFFVTKPLKRI